MKIIELNISARSKHCLLNAGYKDVEDLRDVSDETLSEIRNLNQACVAEIRKAIVEYFSTNDVIISSVIQTEIKKKECVYGNIEYIESNGRIYMK